MNRTANYNLCQFEAGDQVQRTDFNEDNAKIDAAIAAEADARQSGDSSLSSRISSLSSTVSGKASQSSLNTLKNQVAKLGNCRIEALTYTGTGRHGTANPTQVTFSARPAFFIIHGLAQFIIGPSPVNKLITTLYNGPVYCDCSWSGNRLSFWGTDADTQLNHNGTVYTVIALYAQDK